ncbi:MAG: arabinose isomerase, partial [Christensenella sp.]
TFPKIAKNREDIETLTESYNSAKLDGILIFLLSYSQGQYLVRAMQNNHLPLALALIQPDETVNDDFEEIDLTVNQGIHGSQDNANCLMRAGISCAYFVGSRFGGDFESFVSDFGAAAKAVTALKTMKISVIGKLAGMGDVITDDMAVYRTLGPEFVYDSIGTIAKYCAEVSQAEINARIDLEKSIFDIDETLSNEAHGEAVKMYLGLKHFLQDGGYSGYTAHFEEFGQDGRFLQLPLLAASSLLSDGYGYAAEGDATTAALCAAMHILCGIANFSEMYMMDLKRDAILLCHAGEGNYKTCRNDKKPFLMNRVFNEGGLANPPTPVFAPQPGKAAVMSLVHISGNSFRLVYAQGEMLDVCSLTKCDMPYMFFKPESGVRACVKKWLQSGGTHHEVVIYGEQMERVKLFCSLLNIEFVLA